MAVLKTAATILALAAAVSALPASTVNDASTSHVKRDPFEIVTYQDANCNGPVSAEIDNLEPGTCWNFGPATFGAFLFNEFNNRGGCRFKIWELPNCHGKATIQYSSSSCVQITDKDGGAYITDGARSAEVICS